MSLLAHRQVGRGRSRSGFLQQFVESLRAVLRSRRELELAGRRSRSQGRSSGLLVALLAFVFLGAGYLLGNAFPWSAGPRTGGLKADAPSGRREGTPPGMIGEGEDTRPLAGTCLLTAAYPDLEQASAAARNLRQQGLRNARPYEWVEAGRPPQWCLVVYFDGPRERDGAIAALRAAAAPDERFDSYRKTLKGWPLERQIQ